MVVTNLSNSFNPVPKTQQRIKQSSAKNAEKKAEIKKKSNKLAKLERNRFSIITNDLDRCYICKGKKNDLHEIFGGSNRQASMKYGLVIPVCRKCHDMIPKSETLTENLHEVGRKAFKKHYKEENFMKIFGKNYIRRNENGKQK